MVRKSVKVTILKPHWVSSDILWHVYKECKTKGMATCVVLLNRAGFDLICHFECQLDIWFIEKLWYFSRPRLVIYSHRCACWWHEIARRQRICKIIYNKVFVQDKSGNSAFKVERSAQYSNHGGWEARWGGAGESCGNGTLYSLFLAGVLG